MQDGSSRGEIVADDDVKRAGRDEIMESEVPSLEGLDFILQTLGHK